MQIMSRFGSSKPVIRPTGHCHATGEAILPGESCIAVLLEQEGSDSFERVDYSVNAWEEGSRPPNLFSFWKTKIPTDTKEDPAKFIDNDLLNELLDRLKEDDRPLRIAFRYVIALALLRRRKLRFIKSEPNKKRQEVWFFTRVPRNVEEPYVEVVRPLVTESDVEDLTESLGEVLRGEFDT
tara:strand:- start:94 stop:636 length:543 start_codon:yes stop_codon:yes gene_type:complete